MKKAEGHSEINRLLGSTFPLTERRLRSTLRPYLYISLYLLLLSGEEQLDGLLD